MQEITKNILEKLETLRDKINENVEYMILKYDLSNNKNHWNCICSAMDWIDVAKENIDSDLIRKEFKYMWKDVYSYLSAVDIIIDGIIQIHRVVFETKDTIFKENTIFKNNLNKNDYEYFKHIRAVFGAHPVNIDEKGNKKYASWITQGIFTDYDFAVLIYDSNKDNQLSKQFGFKINEVNQFLWKYVQYLDEIYLQIFKKQEEFINDKKKIVIKKSDSALEQIDILMQENEKRLNSEYYEQILKELKIIFATEIKQKGNQIYVLKYREILKKRIDEIYYSLQNMQYIDLKVYNDLNPKYSNKDRFGYAFGKLTSIVHSKNYEYPFDIIRKDLEKNISNNMLCDYDNCEELYVILLTSLYMESIAD